MADRSRIEWTDATWNPIRGCTRVSQGCVNCYAEIMAARFSGPGQWGEGLAQIVRGPGGRVDHRWTGKLVQAPDDVLTAPLRWHRPRRIFVNSTSDLFHEAVPDAWIDRVFAVMALARQHTFQVLTKRSARMREYIAGGYMERIAPMILMGHMAGHGGADGHEWQYPEARSFHPNVWLGTSIEDQATADERIPHLLATPAAVRFVSAEPLLGAVDLTRAIPRTARSPLRGANSDGSARISDWPNMPQLDWIITGGESGPGARPMHLQWVRDIRDQCIAAGVAYFHKQNGEWVSVYDRDRDDPDWRKVPKPGDWNRKRWLNLAGGQGFHGDRLHMMRRVGKASAGRLLDGRTWDQMPGGAG